MSGISESGWHTKFTTEEIAVSQDIVPASKTIEWMFYTSFYLLGFLLFIHAGHRLNDGDSFGATLSCIAAIVVISAPILATYFYF